MPPLPHARCAVCGFLFAVRRNGVMREHRGLPESTDLGAPAPPPLPRQRITAQPRGWDQVVMWFMCPRCTNAIDAPGPGGERSWCRVCAMAVASIAVNQWDVPAPLGARLIGRGVAS